MPSPTYASLVSTVSAYIDGAKAKDIVDRQLRSVGTDADSMTKADLGKLLVALTTATKLYVSDKDRRDEMAVRIGKLAA